MIMIIFQVERKEGALKQWIWTVLVGKKIHNNDAIVKAFARLRNHEITISSIILFFPMPRQSVVIPIQVFWMLSPTSSTKPWTLLVKRINLHGLNKLITKLATREWIDIKFFGLQKSE